MATFTDTALRDIQGLGIAGFNKDHQELIFVRFGDQAGGRHLLSWLQPLTASAWEVGTFNELFREIRTRTGGDEPLAATWLGLLISAAGYQTLGVATSGLPAGTAATAFADGMAARAQAIGDTDPADIPTSWLAPFRPGAGVHACIVIAADDEGGLDRLVTAVGNEISASGCECVFQERGRTLPPPLTGHGHFGFKDGISQPAIVGYTTTPTPTPQPPEPPPVAPGEFVLDYPDQAETTVSTSGSLWANGSFVVFRRLHQNVAGFRAQTATGVPGSNPALTPIHAAAALVGRWQDGAPLELHPTVDPGALTSTPNAFQYKESPFNDDDGHKCPHFAHIRKANPRDETTPTPSADTPSRHRIIRRGVPYGPPLPEGAADDGVDRGLHFFGVVGDVVRQFEFIQSSWLNQPTFPGGKKTTVPGQYGPTPQETPDGPDPIMGENTSGKECLLVQAGGHDTPLPIKNQLVNVTAGEYFFLPSISAIGAVAAGTTS